MSQVKLKYHHYRFYNQFDITFHTQMIEKKLKYLIDPFAIQFSNNRTADVTFCRSKIDMPKSGHEVHSGNYKGIAWSVAVANERKEGSIGISFYSSHSSDFLFPRMVLIPLLRAELSQIGGFSAIGSSFCHNDTRFIVVGRPGTGKTKLLLEAVDEGANFVGDDEFMIGTDGEIAFLYDCIELRRKTVAGTIFWGRLSKAQKFNTIKNELISKLTGGKISFNIVVAPIQLGISAEKSKSYNRTVFVMLSPEAKEEKVSKEAIIDSCRQYETDHMNLFGDYIFGKEALEESLKSMDSYLSKCDLWQMPSGVDANKVLNL